MSKYYLYTDTTNAQTLYNDMRSHAQESHFQGFILQKYLTTQSKNECIKMFYSVLLLLFLETERVGTGRGKERES